MKGTTVCLAHGGGAPQVRAKVATRIARAEALAELGRMRLFDGATDVDPDRVLLAELGRTAAAVRGRQYERREVDERGAEWSVVTNTDVGGTPRLVHRLGGGIDPTALR